MLDPEIAKLLIEFGGGRVKLYVDNVLKADIAGPSGLNNLIRTNNYIGRSNWSGDPCFKGLIDEVRVYNRALTASEIQDHYLNPYFVNF